MHVSIFPWSCSRMVVNRVWTGCKQVTSVTRWGLRWALDRSLSGHRHSNEALCLTTMERLGPLIKRYQSVTQADQSAMFLLLYWATQLYGLIVMKNCWCIFISGKQTLPQTIFEFLLGVNFWPGILPKGQSGCTHPLHGNWGFNTDVSCCMPAGLGVMLWAKVHLI